MTRPVAILAALLTFIVLAVGRPCGAASTRNGASNPAGDALTRAVERYAGEDTNYQRRINDYLAARSAGKRLTATEKRRYSNAYVYAGTIAYRQGNARSAAYQFRQAIAIDETNPLPYYCLGLLERWFDGLKPAIDNLRYAANLGGPLRAASREELTDIVRSLTEQAQALTARGCYIDAARCYEFLTNNFQGSIKATALKRLKATEDEVAAERLLVEARRNLGMGRQGDARKLLKKLMTTYSWTRAGETAKKLYRGDDTLDVEVESKSPAGRYAAREKWIDLETANCIVYYKNTKYAKLVAKRVEDTLARVTKQLNYTGLDWHKDKCKVFVFDDEKAWREFVEESETTSEWAAGFAYGALREVYMHAGYGDIMLNEVLPHELTHVIHREYAEECGGDEDTDLPLWLLEGLACYNEFTGKDQCFGAARSALDSKRFIPLGRLTALRNYPHHAGEITLYYAESLTLVEFIIERYGHEGLVRVHKKLRRGRDFDKLIKRALKVDVEEFESAWHNYIRTKKQ